MKTVKMHPARMTGPALNWAVAKCNGYRDANDPAEHTDPDEALGEFNWTFMREPGVAAVYLCSMRYETDWRLSGPIIEHERITIMYRHLQSQKWFACRSDTPEDDETIGYFGPTPLIAAMRCFVGHKTGQDEYGDDLYVDVPEEFAAYIEDDEAATTPAP